LNGALGGGGLYAFNNSDTTLTNVFFDTNLAFGGAGMVAELSSPGLFQVVFIDNIALFGGGIAILDAAATLNQVAFLGNLAAFEGGGLYNDLSTTTLENATFVNNDAGDGGGIYNIEATLELTNITFFGNIASFDGGAVLNFDGLMLMNNVTLADNQATDGGGIFNTDSGLVDAFNSIFWNNSPTEIENDLSTSSIVDSIVDGGCPAGSTCTNVVNADPLLNPLADNGGFSSTMSLQAGSPAVDAAGGSQACAASDQRGVSRPQGAGCDMGAVEVGDDTPPTVTSTSLLSRYTGKGPSQFTVAFSEAMNDTAGNSGANDVTNADNYLLIEAGANEVVDTKSCASGLQGDDVQVEVIDVVYNSASFTTTVFLPDELSIGVYRLFVCGTSTLTDASLNALNDGEDTKVNFIVGEDAESGDKGSLDLADSGTTEFHFRRITVFVPENAVPGGETNCRIVITMKGDSGVYGFSLDDTLWDVKIVCDHGEVTMFYAPLTICIRPVDGVVADKQLFHRHSGSFNPLARTAYLTGSVCGQTRFLSLFTLAELSLPETGFAPGVETIRGPQPAEMAYTASDLMLSIPTLGVQLDIVGVPQSANGWDVSWLASSQAGYLYGTAFPTWAGNSVLTAHVWNADNTAGPFHQLKALQAGDQLSITAGGSTYTYAVRSNELVSERNLAVMAQSNSSMITLVTCEGFMEGSGEYRFRRVVQAVLIRVD
jgi:LPXTG-site transpeptidase (sortase) family protein